MLAIKEQVQAPVAFRLRPAPLVEFDVPLPAALARFGATTRASLYGAEDAPLVVVLGGISADCFPGQRPGQHAGWWCGLVGPDCAIDPAEFRILGIDFISDPEGEVAPGTADQAEVVCAALDRLGIARAHAVVGASYGGMIALALAERHPDRVGRIVIVSADAAPHPASTAVRSLQRRIAALGLENEDAEEALSIARGIAMLTYRTREEFADRFEGGIDGAGTLARSEPGDYLRARGDAFVARMTPQRFLSLSASIDRHRVEPARIGVPTLLIGADTDQLVPPAQIEALARELGGPCRLHMLTSLYGHDMFLKDADRVSTLVGPYLREAL